MATRFDHLTLSAYVDGELDRRTMREVERYLDSDPQARQFVLDAMHATVLLRAGGNEAVLEPVPERLLNVFRQHIIPPVAQCPGTGATLQRQPGAGRQAIAEPG